MVYVRPSLFSIFNHTDSKIVVVTGEARLQGQQKKMSTILLSTRGIYIIEVRMYKDNGDPVIQNKATGRNDPGLTLMITAQSN